MLQPVAAAHRVSSAEHDCAMPQRRQQWGAEGGM